MKIQKSIDQTTKWLLTCGQAGCLLFIVTFLVYGQLQANYSALKFPVSSLAIGPWGWIQRCNFLISGTMIFLLAIGFRKASSSFKNSRGISLLIGTAGIGLFGAGVFSTDPVYGYPHTDLMALAQSTFTGRLHDVCSMLVFICLPVSCFKMIPVFRNLYEKNWVSYSVFSVTCVIVFFILTVAGFQQVPGLVEFAGLFQRLAIIIGFVWLSALAGFVVKNSGLSIH